MQADYQARDPEEQEDKVSRSSSQLEREANLHYTKNKKIIFWLYLLLGTLFVVSQGVLVGRNLETMRSFSNSDDFYFSNQVSYEWKRGFITDILVTSDPDCPSGYEHTVEFNWPGTGFGCFCQPSVNSSFVLEGYCTPLLIQAQCRNIQSQTERWANIWRNSSNICARRSKVSFFNEEKYDGTNKICGSSQSLVIVPQSEPCPLVNLTFAPPQLEDHYSQVTDVDQVLDPLFGTFNATSPYSFYSYPLSKFSVSEHEFCLVDEDSGLTPSHSEFVLLNYERGCEQAGNYQILDSMTEIEFYANNPTLQQLSAINGFPKPGNWKYFLGVASLPSWTYYCRHNYDGKFRIPRAIQMLNFEFFDAYYYIALVQILLLAAIGATILILGLRRALRKEVYPVGYKQVYLPQDFCLSIVRFIIDLSCKAVVFSLAFYSAWVCVVNWNWFKSAINMGCSDGSALMVTHVIEPFRDMYQQAILLTIAQIVIIVFVVILDLIHLYYVYHNELKFYLVNSYGVNMVEVEKDNDLDWLKHNETDKNLMKIDDLEGVQDDNVSEKFRVTMALNGFDNERSIEEEVPSRGKILKKKKKKIGAFRREQKKDNTNTLVSPGEFNPYSLDDPSILGLNSLDNLNSLSLEEPSREISRRKPRNKPRK